MAQCTIIPNVPFKDFLLPIPATLNSEVQVLNDRILPGIQQGPHGTTAPITAWVLWTPYIQDLSSFCRDQPGD
jgi:hypothetical protein